MAEALRPKVSWGDQFFFNPWFRTQNLDVFWGRAPSGRAGLGPPPFFRAEILKKFSGKNVLENNTYFLTKNTFWFIWDDFWAYSKGHAPSGRAPSGRAGPGPPPFCRAEILKKFSGKSVPENYTLFFVKKRVFGYFTYQNALGPI